MVVNYWVPSTDLSETVNFRVEWTRAMALRVRRAHRSGRSHTRTPHCLQQNACIFAPMPDWKRKREARRDADAVSRRTNLTYKHLKYDANRLRGLNMKNAGTKVNGKCRKTLYLAPEKH